jgi:NCS2 family nucleobase:cation symporter-2
MPPALAPLLHSGVLLSTVTAVALNLYFNGPGTGPARVAAEPAH